MLHSLIIVYAVKSFCFCNAYVRVHKQFTCFIAETEEPHLPPMTDPGDQVDPYDLACSGGGYGCIIGKPQRFSTPMYCFNGYCTYIQYNNQPWTSDKGLTIQPLCTLPIGQGDIAPGKLRLRIFLFGNVISVNVSITYGEFVYYAYIAGNRLILPSLTI